MDQRASPPQQRRVQGRLTVSLADTTVLQCSKPAAGCCGEGFGVGGFDEGEEAVLVLKMRGEGCVDEGPALWGEAHQSPTAIRVGAGAGDEAAADETVDAFGQSAAGHHGVFGELTGLQLERVARSPERGEQVELCLAQPEAGIDGCAALR